ncbi:rod shape-determining protein MreD [Umboniibacter marinipuniceus]|uniref:Rod shape-determining protein MreD n=1 Tax=Umboniibacter marinipuniceus TaxID=569599 RepID=A0A3M0AAN6_9GAMM|nr:rod shape-determining protein MreD [Umboniibacter marinipuniceus]RMA79455.1 rod shape-determining protein MreD [Umboniibacter marinipuniceus]
MLPQVWMAAVITVLVAVLFTVASVVDPIYRPSLLGLSVVFWCIYFPDKVSLGTAFICGIIADALTGALFGSHVLGFCVVAYLTTLMNRRLLMFTWVQRILFVFVLMGISQAIINWGFAIRGEAMPGLSYLLPATTSALVWPIWKVFMKWLHPKRAMPR